MKWVKKGLIFKPEGQKDWVTSHAMLPVADHIVDDIFRIYFSGRDEFNRSLTGFVEIDINAPQKILHISSEPVLKLGDLGAFDDNGVSPTWMINHLGRKYLYYFGWNKGSLVRAAEVSGLAISEDNGKIFQRFSRAPIIDRSDAEPYQILVISCILIEDGIWRMWYDSADEWLTPDLPRYNIKYAESIDGINWLRNGVVSVDYKSKDESRVSRASVLKENSIYKMWHCYAIGSGGYRMGYAESENGLYFDRKDDSMTIQTSITGWDSEMVCYPHVFNHKGQKIMLYCGNGYGRTGFGMAVEE
jgi:hypothetical protein